MIVHCFSFKSRAVGFWCPSECRALDIRSLSSLSMESNRKRGDWKRNARLDTTPASLVTMSTPAQWRHALTSDDANFVSDDVRLDDGCPCWRHSRAIVREATTSHSCAIDTDPHWNVLVSSEHTEFPLQQHPPPLKRSQPPTPAISIYIHTMTAALVDFIRILLNVYYFLSTFVWYFVVTHFIIIVSLYQLVIEYTIYYDNAGTSTEHEIFTVNTRILI